MLNFRRVLILMGLFVSAVLSVFSQTGDAAPGSGDAAMAEKYVLWAMDLIQHERWTEAEIGLERAADFAGVSSDLSYLLALCRSHLNRPRGAVIYALDTALETNRWKYCEVSSALLLIAETYLALKRYSFALFFVNKLPPSADTMMIQLRAEKGMGDHQAFLRLMARALDMYEHDPRPVSILFDVVDAKVPRLNERELVDLALQRLPLFIQKDPSLAYKAVPFMRNIADARRLVEAYRAEHAPHPESLPAALELGVIGEETMMRDFFSYKTDQYSAENREEYVLRLDLVRELWRLLRNDASRDEFKRNLSAFSGVIIDDSNDDSFPESFTRYEAGRIQSYAHDSDQDRLSELSLYFYADDELPRRAEVEVMDDDSGLLEIAAFHVRAEDQEKMYIEYFTYPSVKSARMGETDYFPVYREFFFAPVGFVPITGGDEDFQDVPLYPRLLEDSISRLTKRSLISFADIIKRPSREFPEAVEEIHLANSVVNRAREVLPDGRVVSEMFFELGEPYLQYADLDTDGRRETRRVFKRERGLPFSGTDPTDYKPVLEKAESDWNGDEIYEYGELYLPGGIIERSWDNDGDGIREHKEVIPDV